MKNYQLAGVALLVIALAGCRGKTRKEEVVASPPKHEFRPVAVPMTYADPQEQADYYATRFWEHFDFTDTAYIHLPEITERAFGNYVQALRNVGKATAAKAVKKMLEQAKKEPLVLHYFAGLYEKYLYEPNSPVMNEELYISVLEVIRGSDLFAEEERTRAEHRLEMALKNRMGTPASDFSFTLVNGKKARLYDIRAEYTLIFFNNPGCHACKEYRDAMHASPVITGLIRDKRLQVVAIYPDEELTEWREYIPQIPAEWINGYDHALVLRGKKLYNLRAIPTLYLLDSKKVVLLKDARIDLVERYLAAVATPSPAATGG
jgi:hypothetical protein